MRTSMSIPGSILVAFYLAVVLHLHLEAKHCAEIDGLWCGFGPLVAGFPWNWIVLFLVDPQYQPSQKSYLMIFIASVAINSLIIYFVGRFIANVVARLIVKLKLKGAT